ncbi:aspartate kinase [Pontibacter ummariensis]|uniref:Aspartokinase n=1 Tax=Pontibacter ummariensis TaxID=1610492 RepID=A0A239K0I8_9BACT|nr:aspartate kinase [Pontibacter ummariensis]PRY06806.1 aspartate kinase [Pontibacter ummariensis]SNT11359.1 aspartate kinase [Pontibacter ummariensis]
MKVLKFGGTSVGSAERMKAVASLINNDEPKIVVLSAMSGTTNALVQIAETLYQNKNEEANALIDALHDKYKQVVEELYTSAEKKKQANELLTEHFDHVRAFTQDLFTIHEERAVLAQGELLSTALFQFFLEEQQINSVLLPALNFMKIDEDEEPDTAYIAKHLKEELEKFPNTKLFITQGYICRNAFGEIDNLKRGGSDYSASLIGAAADVEEIQIWTDIDGMHNNDPRIVKDTYPIAELSFDEAAELAYFGAKILHPSSVTPAKQKNIPVKLLNTMQPEAKGTTISAESTGGTIKAVAAKDGITAIKIKSGRMLLAYGFLRSVFEVFERYKTPIDMITTSEVAVSLTIDNARHLEEIVAELKEFGQVEVDQEQTIICVVGDFIEERSGSGLKIFQSLKDISVRMISYGGSKNNISLLINTKDKVEALTKLNEGIFDRNTNNA